jgi:hypothetical protein
MVGDTPPGTKFPQKYPPRTPEGNLHKLPYGGPDNTGINDLLFRRRGKSRRLREGIHRQGNRFPDDGRRNLLFGGTQIGGRRRRNGPGRRWHRNSGRRRFGGNHGSRGGIGGDYGRRGSFGGDRRFGNRRGFGRRRRTGGRLRQGSFDRFLRRRRLRHTGLGQIGRRFGQRGGGGRREFGRGKRNLRRIFTAARRIVAATGFLRGSPGGCGDRPFIFFTLNGGPRFRSAFTGKTGQGNK